MSNRNLVTEGSAAAYSTIAFKSFSQIAALLAATLLIRVLTKEEYGIYSLFYATIGLIGLVASFGLTNLLQRFLPEYYHRAEYGAARLLLDRAVLLRLVTSLVLLGLVFGFWESLAPLLKVEGHRRTYGIFALVLLSYQQWMLLKTALEAYFLHAWTQGAYLFFLLAKCAGYGALFGAGARLSRVLAVDVAANLLLLGVYIYLVRRRIPRRGGKMQGLGGPEGRRLLRYGAYSNFNDAGAQLLDTGVDNLMIAYFLDPVAVGVYAFCDRLSRMIGRVNPMVFLADVVRPLFFSVGSASGDEDVRDMGRFILKFTYLFYVPVFFLLVVAGSEIVDLVFGKYGEHRALYLTVFAFAVVNAAVLPIGLAAQLREKVDVVFYSKAFGIYNLIAAIVLIGRWGVMGAAVATGTATVMKNAAIWWFVRDSLPLRDLAGFFLVLLSYWAAAGAAAAFLAGLVAGALTTVLLSLVFFALAGAGYLVLFLPLSERETRLFRTLLGQGALRGLFDRYVSVRQLIPLGRGLRGKR